MKGVFIFNHQNDIVFVKNDPTFDKHVSAVAVTEGLIEAGKNQNIEDGVDPNIILQLYSPLVASQRFMTGQTKNPYSKITTANGFLLVLKQFSDYVFVAINGDGEETAEFLHRKLLILNQIITFLHGPCIEEIRPDKHKERVTRWKLIGRFLQTWCDLYKSEQSILVEAVERLHVNQMLNSRSIELMENALSVIKAAGEKHATHAMLVVNSKLLSLYSVRNATALSSADQMMLILLSNMLFGADDNQASATNFCSLSSRQTRSRSASSLYGPVKIGSTGNLKEQLTKPNPLLEQDDSSSDLEINNSSSDQKESESSDNQSQYSFVKVDSPPRDKKTSFPDLTDTLSQASVKVESMRILDSGRVPHSHVLRKSQSDAAFTYSSQKSYESVSSQLIGQSSIGATSNLASQSSQSDRYSQDAYTVPNIVVSSPRQSLTVSSEDYNSNTLSDSRNVKDVNEVVYQRPHGEIHLPNPVSDKMSSKHDSTTLSWSQQSSVVDNATQSSSQKLHSVPETSQWNNHASQSHNRTSQTHHLQPRSMSLTVSRPKSTLSELSWRTPDDTTEYPCMTVMLVQGEAENVPHMVHCVPVMHGIYLAIVCQRTKVLYAQVINKTVKTLHTVLAVKNSNVKHTPKQVQDFIDGNIKKLGELLKKSKGATHIERLIVDIANKWESAKRENFLKFYQPDSPNRVHFPPKLEGALSSMLDKLLDLFRLLYLSKKYLSPEHHRSLMDGIRDVHIAVYKGLLDYKDYISIKSQRNVAMTTYMNEFPGMIHFLFMNRSTNHVIASSFSEHALEEESEHQMHVHVQKQVWQMYERMRQKLALGYTTVTAREGGFHFSYFVWFEDNQGGFNIAPQRPYNGLRSSDSLLPGVISFNFYAWLQRTMFPGVNKKALHCYEMFVMHVGLVPTNYALGHCRKLAGKLWESSGENSTSVSLL